MLNTHYGIQLVTPPATEPLALADVKNYLRVDADITQDDALINSLITAARQLIEKNLNRQIVTATWLWTIDSFFGYEMPGGQLLLGDRPIPQQRGGGGIWPYLSILRPPRSPLQSVVSINYIDPSGASLLLDPSQYIVDTVSVPGRLAPAYGTVWPVTQEVPNAVSITFTAGYSTVPGTITTALYMMIASWYQNRDSWNGRAGDVLPVNLRWLLASEDDGTYR